MMKIRVYISDIKKVFQWYNTLHSAGLVELQKKKKVQNQKIKRKMNNIIEIPTRPKRKFVSEGFSYRFMAKNSTSI